MRRHLFAVAAFLSVAGPAAGAFAAAQDENQPRGDRMVRPGQHEPIHARADAPAPPARAEPARPSPSAPPSFTAPRAERARESRPEGQARQGWRGGDPGRNDAAVAAQAGANWQGRDRGAWRQSPGVTAVPNADARLRSGDWRGGNQAQPRGDWNRNDDRWNRNGDQAQDRRDWDRNRDQAQDRRNWDRNRDQAQDRRSWDGNRDRWNRHDGDRGQHWRRYGQGQRFFYRGRSFFRWRVDPFIWPSTFYQRSWRLHETLPPVFLSETYYIDDWADFGLPPAPYGYRWIRVGEDALMVDIYSGEIVDMIPGVFVW